VLLARACQLETPPTARASCMPVRFGDPADRKDEQSNRTTMALKRAGQAASKARNRNGYPGLRLIYCSSVLDRPATQAETKPYGPRTLSNFLNF